MSAKHDALDPVDHAESQRPPALIPTPTLTPTSPSQTASNPTSTSTAMASPTSQTSQASQPSPLPALTLAEQTFTPLSMDMADFGSPDDNVPSKTLPAASDGRRLLSSSRSMGDLRSQANLSRSSSRSTGPSASAAGSSNIVSVMVESYESLAARAANANLGYQLLRSRSATSRPAGVTSSPSTISPSPSPSPSQAANESTPDATSAEAAGRGASVGPTLTSPVAAQSDPTTAPTTATEAPNPDATSTDANSGQPLDAAALPSRPPSSPNPSSEAAVHTSIAGTSLSHPAPDPNKLSQAGNFLGNIAALEATAERMSMAESIEDAIREEHNELKRSESRRSSILRARAASVASETQRSVASRKNSILDTNSAARSGGYSPGGFVMASYNPSSAASQRLRSGSKSSSTGLPAHIPENKAVEEDAHVEDFASEYRFLPRHGPGKASTRSVASKLSLVQIAELEDPTSLTKEALDEAERAEAAGETSDVDDDIKASAHQFIEAEFADLTSGLDLSQPIPVGPQPDGDATLRLQLHQPDDYQPYGHHHDDALHDAHPDRPMTSASMTTLEQAQVAFGDFDGVHCDPDTVDFPPRQAVPVYPLPPPPPPQLPRGSIGTMPTAYIDPATGQQMLYYPAPVPAMLNLPPKLSKKPKRQSRVPPVLGAQPRTSHESRVWLPESTGSLRKSNEDAPYLGSLTDGVGASGTNTPPLHAAGMEPGVAPSHARQHSEASTVHAPDQRDIRLPPRLTDADKRKSRPITGEGLPPQLRATAFFDLPSEVLPKIDTKDGSAMSVLDSLLDASAAAPVNAFTDHVYAGKLGAEVYGPEKKRKKKPAAAPVADDKAKRKTIVKRSSSGDLPEPAAAEDKAKRKTLVKRNSSGNLLDPEAEKKRASRFSLFGHKRKNDSDADDSDDARSTRSDRSRNNASPNQLAPGPDEGSGESDEEEPVYQGPPTTLLAELQIRKQQNKLRTRGVHYQTEGGIRTTLLELDTVAEMERKARHGKRVTLAWEDPAAVAHRDEEEDEDVPLGMLYVAKNTDVGKRATVDVSAFMHEVRRPPGLLEQREIEENEPLSRRRDRLQGRVSQQPLPTSLSSLQNRMSQIPLGGPGLRSQSRMTLMLQPQSGTGGSRTDSMLGSSQAAGQEDDSEPEETLAARKARLAAENPLPPPRPVSGAFMSELLKEFGPDEKEEKKEEEKEQEKDGSKKEEEDKAKATADDEAAVPEEEETLGQRRRRLQKEREAREREMAYSSLTRAATPEPSSAMAAGTPIRPVTMAAPALAPVNKPMPLSSLLSAHPAGGHNFNPQPQPQQPPQRRLNMLPQPTPMMAVASLPMDPREQARQEREAETLRQQREMEAKLAAMRAQMPTSVSAPGSGAKPGGGYMNGMFNDGLGGAGVGPAGFAAPQQPYRASMMPSASMGMLGTGYGALGTGSTASLGAQVPLGGVVYSPGVGGAVAPVGGVGMYGPGPAGLPTQGHVEMVERWRHGVMP
ncbi:hypothetical protein VTJ83DRAFT_6938 [Remersonia thermophila]|uniref:Uncharacterized protein n=1 Tax=Remersonia thermophila TaxID=72144 RepID=A0ABR4D630_9PEZI